MKKIIPILLLAGLAQGWTQEAPADAAAAPSAPGTPEKTKYNADEPLVTEGQYFTYQGLSSSNVTLRTFKGFNRNEMIRLIKSNPKAAMDNLGLLILVHKALQGIDVATMKPEELDQMVKENIAQDLARIGRSNEANAYYYPEKGDAPKLPSTRSLVYILEEVSYKLLRGVHHQRPLLSDPNLHTNG